MCLARTTMSGGFCSKTSTVIDNMHVMLIRMSCSACVPAKHALFLALAHAALYVCRDAADKLSLKRVPPEGSSEDLFSIYDGSKFVFRQSGWTIITLWRMVQRYWLTYFTFQAPKQMLQKFLRLYDLQSQGRSFDTPEAFLKELGLYDLTQQSMHTYLKVTVSSVPQSIVSQHDRHAFVF